MGFLSRNHRYLLLLFVVCSAVNSLCQKRLAFQGCNCFLFSRYNVGKVIGVEMSFAFAVLMLFVELFPEHTHFECLADKRCFFTQFYQQQRSHVVTLVSIRSTIHIRKLMTNLARLICSVQNSFVNSEQTNFNELIIFSAIIIVVCYSSSKCSTDIT